DLVSVLFDEKRVPALAAKELHADIPPAAQVRDRSSNRRFGGPFLGENSVDSVRHNLIVATLHHPGRYGNTGSSGVGLGAPPAASRPCPEGDSRFISGYLLGNLFARNVEPGRIPTDDQFRALIGKPCWLAHAGLDGLDRRNPFGDTVEPGEPRLPFAGVIPLDPCLHGGQHPQSFLAPALVVPPRTMVWRAGLPRRHEDIFFAKQKPGALRAADGLSPAVRDHGGASLQVDAGNREHLGSG